MVFGTNMLSKVTVQFTNQASCYSGSKGVSISLQNRQLKRRYQIECA